MATLPALDSSIDLRAVTVRPTWGAREHRRWDRLVEEHHYLAFHGVIGKGLRHVAVHGEIWLALIGWQPGAFKLGARDRWIGWSAEQQFRRLHLIANNSRFVILTPERVPNLASRVLGLSLRRLSADMHAAHGYPALLAETFVDVSRFAGTCYRAANWRSLGLTRGFAREPGGAARWRHHGQPKEVFVFELTDGAPEALSTVEMPANWSTEQHTEPMAAPRLRSLFECLGEVPEYRHARGKRYALNTILTLAVAARLAGYRGVNAFAQFAALLSQEQLKAVGAFWSPSKQRYTPPAITTFHRRRARRTRGAARPRAQPLAHREPPALCARLHLRRRSLPGVRAPPAQKSGLLEQRGHRHRALRRPLPLRTRGQPALRRPRPGGPRRDHDRAHRLIPRDPQPHQDVPQGGTEKRLCPSRPKTPSGSFGQPP